ncbi:MAG: RNA methyltransferase [Chloroflexi bacterium]|nr:RNA methyltransferase [Chloroflexota bacterium]
MPATERRRFAGPTISSPANERIRFVRSLYRTTTRRKEGLFIAEGVRLVEDALEAGARPEAVLVVPEELERTARGRALLERLLTFRCWPVTGAVLKAISDTVTPQGVIAVFPVPRPPERLDLGPVFLILDRVRDPGNAGTLLRSADASGVVRTAAFVESVDAFSPKVVRAAMGAHFRLTILEDVRWSDLLPHLGERPRWLATAHGGIPYDQIDWKTDCALILGGEAEGAGPEAEIAATGKVTIPMAGTVESLNAAMAGTILLFEAARARRARARSTR